MTHSIVCDHDPSDLLQGTIRYDSILTWTRKLSIQLNLADIGYFKHTSLK